MKIPSLFYPAWRNPIVLGVAVAWTVWVLFFYSLALRERIGLGHWPYFMDPGTIGKPRFPIHDMLVGYSLLALLGIAVVWSTLVVLQSLLMRPFRPWHALAALLIGWIPLLVGFMADPGGVFEWFFD